jgi:hypothetical protein
MPGAPNRPPPIDPPPAPAAPVAAEAGRLVLRRLAPSRVALNLDSWKGAPSPDLLVPFERAETAFAQGDWPNAVSALDQLSVRFAEPRWPTMLVPFRDLRVAIPAPQPPQWDPEHSLEAAEKEKRKLRRSADLQLALATACVAWMNGHGLAAPELESRVATARSLLDRPESLAAFWDELDAVWTAVHDRVPAPRSAARPSPRPAGPAA